MTRKSQEPRNPTRSERDDEGLEERYLAQVSALIDGEIDREQLLPTLDYLVNTGRAREFYRQARAIDGVLHGFGEKPTREQPGVELWRRIVDDATAVTPAADESSRGDDVSEPQAPHWWSRHGWLAAAATLILAVLVWVGLGSPVSDQPESTVDGDRVAALEEVTIGGRAGEMTDSRFLSLATELLQADRRYRQEMLELMVAVEERPMTEASTEESRYGESTLDYEEDRWEGGESDSLGSRPRIEIW